MANHTAAIHVLKSKLRLQDDVVTETKQRDAYLRNAPAAEQGLFLVPIVIE